MKSLFKYFPIWSLIGNWKLEIGNSTMGFTIVETLVAVAVLMLAVTAPLTLASRSLASAEVARREVTAVYLVQEGVEFIRNFKDTNAVGGKGGDTNWLSGIDNSCFESGGCGVDPTESSGKQIQKCDGNNDDCTLYQYTNQNDPLLYGLYALKRHGNDWKATDYKRKIALTTVDTDKEVKVTATVTWTEGVGSHSVSATSNLFNWYESP